jgi:tetratricopeptide (TPR) repeat protein
MASLPADSESASGSGTGVRGLLRGGHRLAVAVGLLMLATGASIAIRLTAGDGPLAAVRRAMRAHDWAAADAAIAAIRRNPARAAEATLWRGRFLRRQDQLAEAEEAFAAAEAAGCDPEPLAHQRMLNAVQSGRIRDFAPAIGRMLAQPTDDLLAEECYEAMTKGYVAAYRIDDALECVTWWLEWQPRNARALVWHGIIHERLERNGTALASYRQAASLDPSSQVAALAAARLAHETGRSDEAEAIYGRCLDRAPEDSDALLGMAECLMHRGDGAAAEVAILDCLCLDLPPEPAARALAALGRIRLDAGHPAEAAPMLAAAIDRDSTQASVHLDYATALDALGLAERARRHRATGKAFADARIRLTTLTRQAIGQPDNPDLRAEAGRVLVELGFVAEGRRWAETALDIKPDHEAARRLLERSAAPDASPAGSGSADFTPGKAAS